MNAKKSWCFPTFSYFTLRPCFFCVFFPHHESVALPTWGRLRRVSLVLTAMGGVTCRESPGGRRKTPMRWDPGHDLRRWCRGGERLLSRKIHVAVQGPVSLVDKGNLVFFLVEKGSYAFCLYGVCCTTWVTAGAVWHGPRGMGPPEEYCDLGSI